jgi:PAS domain-containing protein
MLAEDIDFHVIFKINPTAMALLTADFVIIDANDAFLEAMHRSLAEIVGQNIFKEFPKMPYDPGNPKWTALEAAVTSGRREVHKVTRYDIEDPGHPGVFQERYWTSAVTPLRGLGGEIEFLELSAREITPIVAELQVMDVEQA